MMILILGGTAEARELASALVATGADVLTSLAGRVSKPALPPGQIRIGGFGGVDGLADFLTANKVAALVDATHPFAARISANATAAAARTGTPLLHLERPGWADHPLAAGWTWVSDIPAAMRAADSAQRPFVSTGRQSLTAFERWADRPTVVRVVEPPSVPLPAAWTVVISRGPYDYSVERQLLIEYGIDAVITKDSGGAHTVAKLEAAHELDIPVVIIQRPPSVAGDMPATNVDQAFAWVQANESRQARCREA
jgi:precorrin-6A/cobalt-precorrin-6A reductase